ncbi:MAG: hypothetical protein MNPFHGCM_03179 [Gemmatimonadaceae bacterium]|nr:hypothetical protein [Gemmatimonadaceae bacterium]
MSSHHDSPGPTRDDIVRLMSAPVPARLQQVCLALAVIGLGTWLAGAATGNARAWQAWQVNWLFFTVMSSAGVMFAAVQRITTARWSRPVIRFMEGYVAWLPIAFVMLMLTIFVGKEHIFPWVITPPTKHEKAIWLGTTFWTLRSIVVFGAITWLSCWYVYTSVRLDVGLVPEWGARWAKGLRDRMRAGYGEERREIHTTHSLQGRLAVILAIVFAFGWIVLAWDHSMSIDPDFYSTMYGWQFFMAGWLMSLMALALIVRAWRNSLNAHTLITESHLHDVGKLCFAFTAFWGYLTFSQFLVIWYGNMGEETFWFHKRLSAPWTGTAIAVGIMAFVLPFFGLLGKFPKIFAPTMTFFAISSLIGLYFHQYLDIYAGAHGNPASMPFGIWEIATFLGFLGLWGWSYLAFMNAFPRMRVVLMTSPYRDEVQVPCDPRTMEPLPAHE